MNRMLTFAMATVASLAFVPAAFALDGNVDAGKKVFAKCAVCHGIGDKKGAIGPILNDVIGRQAGTQADFVKKGAGGYSKQMIAAGAAGLVWDEAKIDEWITNPKKMIPGTKMAFAGLPKEQDRADVIAYVKTFSKAAQ